MNVKEAIQTRRAYRSLAPVEISDQTVRELAEAAGLAASCFNKQPWRLVFVRKPDVLASVFESLDEGNKWATAASMIVAVASRPELDCRTRGRDYYLFDTGMATAQMILRAFELGLVAHPIAGYDPVKTRDVLGVPEDMTVIALVIVGKHADSINDLLSEKQAKTEPRRPARRPPGEVFFLDRYGEGLD